MQFYIGLLLAIVAIVAAQREPKSCHDAREAYKSCMASELAKSGADFELSDVTACFAMSGDASCRALAHPSDFASQRAASATSPQAKYQECMKTEMSAQMDSCVDTKTTRIQKVDHRAERGEAKGKGKGERVAKGRNNSLTGILGRLRGVSNFDRRAARAAERPSMLAFLLARAEKCGVAQCAKNVVGSKLAAEPSAYEQAQCAAQRKCKAKRTSAQCAREEAEMSRAACECGVDINTIAQTCSQQSNFAPTLVAKGRAARTQQPKRNCNAIKAPQLFDPLDNLCQA